MTKSSFAFVIIFFLLEPPCLLMRGFFLFKKLDNCSLMGYIIIIIGGQYEEDFNQT